MARPEAIGVEALTKPDKKAAKEQDKIAPERAKGKTKNQLLTDRIELENERIRHLNWQVKWDNRLRLCAAVGIFAVVLFWLVAVLAVLVLQGCPWFSVKLSDTVLVSLLATTTLNVIGLLSTVVWYLFPKPAVRDDRQERDKAR